MTRRPPGGGDDKFLVGLGLLAPLGPNVNNAGSSIEARMAVDTVDLTVAGGVGAFAGGGGGGADEGELWAARMAACTASEALAGMDGADCCGGGGGGGAGA
jgi:hypothetical protein